MIGVWNSVNPWSHIALRSQRTTFDRSIMLLVHRVAAQVEEAVGQPGFLGVFGVAEDRQRQFLRRAQHLDLGHIDLDLAGRHLGVHQRRIARLHPAIDADHPFGAHLFQRGKGRAVAVGTAPA